VVNSSVPVTDDHKWMSGV